MLSIRDGKFTQHAYIKMEAAQTETENCVSHNGGLIPVPGRDIMVQGWYQGDGDVAAARDAARVRAMAQAVRDLANATR